MTRHVVVFGASGGVGRHVVDQALERGWSVRAIHRSAPGGEPRPRLEVQVVKDVLEPQPVARAVEGADAVLCCVGQRRTQPRNPWSRVTSPLDLNSRLAGLLIEALGSSSIPVVLVSAGGVGDSRGGLGVMLDYLFYRTSIGHAYRDLAVMEDLLRASPLRWVAVRPVTLTHGRPRGRVRVTDRFGLFATISRADVAGYMLDLVEDREAVDTRTPMIAG